LESPFTNKSLVFFIKVKASVQQTGRQSTTAGAVGLAAVRMGLSKMLVGTAASPTAGFNPGLKLPF